MKMLPYAITIKSLHKERAHSEYADLCHKNEGRDKIIPEDSILSKIYFLKNNIDIKAIENNVHMYSDLFKDESAVTTVADSATQRVLSF